MCSVLGGLALALLTGSVALVVYAGPCYENQYADAAAMGCIQEDALLPGGAAACPSAFNSAEVPGAPSCEHSIVSRQIIIGTHGNRAEGKWEQSLQDDWCYLYQVCQHGLPFLHGDALVYNCYVVETHYHGKKWTAMHATGDDCPK